MVGSDDDDAQRDEAAAIPPPPLPLDVSNAVVVTKRGGRRHLLAGVAVVGVVAVGVAAFAMASDGAPDADAALADAQQVVEGAEGYRFEQLEERHIASGDPEGAGSESTTRTLLTGAVAGPERWRITMDYGDDFEDLGEQVTMLIEDTVYVSGFAPPEAAGPPWVAAEAGEVVEPSEDELTAMYEEMAVELSAEEDPYVDELRLDVAIAAYLSVGPTPDPAGVVRAVTEAVQPEVAEERADGGLLLRAQLPPDAELQAALEGEELPPVDLTLQLDAEHRPVMARFTATAGSASADVEITFSDWGTPIAVDPPADADIDRTPWIMEEDLAAVDPALLVAPTAVPGGLSLATVSTYDEMFDSDEPCPSVSMMYSSPEMFAVDQGMVEDPEAAFDEWEDMDYLDLTIMDPDCADGMYDTGYFDAEVAGLPATGSDGFWEVLVGDVVVSISSSYDQAEMETLIASLQPTSVEQLGAAIPEWAQEQGPAGMGYGPLFLGPPVGWSSMAVAAGL